MADLVLAGVPKEEARRWVGADQNEPLEFEVWEENWQTAEVFLVLATQWRFISGMGAVVQGLDYAAIPPTLDMMGIDRPNWKKIFEGLRIMERAALDTWEGKADSDE